MSLRIFATLLLVAWLPVHLPAGELIVYPIDVKTIAA
jgi:hypothetical protein